MFTTPDTTREAATRPGGFTLVETLVAAIVAALVIVALADSITSSVGTRQSLAPPPGSAFHLAQEIYELAIQLPSQPSGTEGVTNGADVVALDSLSGAVFSPPIRADKTALSGYAGWTQQVALSIYALDDLDSATTMAISDGLSPSEGCVYKLSVTILARGDEVDAFEWWIKP